MFEVKLRSGHPTGTYRRGGKVFQRGEVIKMASVPRVIADDKWLVVTAVAEKAKPAEPPVVRLAPEPAVSGAGKGK